MLFHAMTQEHSSIFADFFPKNLGRQSKEADGSLGKIVGMIPHPTIPNVNLSKPG